MPKYLTIDTGGTNIKFALMDENATIYDQGEVPTPHTNLEEYVETLGKIYDNYADEGVEAVCMSAPGRIDSNTAFFYTGGALSYIHNLNLAEAVKDRIPVPFVAENDAKAAALAELWKGSMQGVNNGIVIVLGTGIGGALILNGKLYRGTTYAAGEFSPMPVNLENRAPSSTWSEINGVPHLIHSYAKAIGEDPANLNGRIFFEAANKGDETALAELETFCENLVTGLASIQMVLDVEKVAIGGGISRQPLLEKTVREASHNMYERFPFYYPCTEPEIVTCAFSSDANMIGALYHYLYEMKS